MRILQVQWIALSVLCSLLLSFWVSFVKFYNSVNSSVQYLTECRLVHNLVFSPLSVLAYKECPQYVGEVKPPSLQWYRTFEIGICRLPFRLSNSFPLCSAPRHCSLSYEVCKPYTHVGFPMSELPTSRIFVATAASISILFFYFLMRIRELRELSFQPYMPPVYPTFFFNASFCRFGRFRFGCFKKVGSG